MEPILTAEGLAKVYAGPHGEVTVLDRCDFVLRPGETVAVIGPSGIGKSTFLNVLSGLDSPTAGTVRFADRTVVRPEPPGVGFRARLARSLRELGRFCLTPVLLVLGLERWQGDLRQARWRNRTLGFIFQFHYLLPDFTALENLLLPVRMKGGTLSTADRERAGGLLAAMGLADRADHLPGELSGGEQQRVAVARAFMNRPAIVMADEPFGNLDAAKGEQLGRLLFELNEREGTSLIIVTHDLELARRADRVLELREGRLAPAATV